MVIIAAAIVLFVEPFIAWFGLGLAGVGGTKRWLIILAAQSLPTAFAVAMMVWAFWLLRMTAAAQR